MTAAQGRPAPAYGAFPTAWLVRYLQAISVLCAVQIAWFVLAPMPTARAAWSILLSWALGAIAYLLATVLTEADSQ